MLPAHHLLPRAARNLRWPCGQHGLFARAPAACNLNLNLNHNLDAPAARTRRSHHRRARASTKASHAVACAQPHKADAQLPTIKSVSFSCGAHFFAAPSARGRQHCLRPQAHAAHRNHNHDRNLSAPPSECTAFKPCWRAPFSTVLPAQTTLTFTPRAPMSRHCLLRRVDAPHLHTAPS